MSDELYEAFERFSIMTVDGCIDDNSAIKKIQGQYGRDIAIQVWGIIKLYETK